MINEILFMQIRLFGAVCGRHGWVPAEGNRVFEECGVWKFIEECYGLLHVSGDECAADDIDRVLRAKGAIA